MSWMALATVVEVELVVKVVEVVEEVKVEEDEEEAEVHNSCDTIKAT